MRYRKTDDRARRFCSVLGDLTDRRPQRWRMIHSVAKQLNASWDEAEAAAVEAETKGWLTMEGRHSVCLTDAGNRLAPTLSPKPKARKGRQRAGKA